MDLYSKWKVKKTLEFNEFHVFFSRLIAPLFAMNIFNFEEKFRERI